MFTLILGEMIPFDEHIFLGWFNHQLVLNLISGCVPNWPKWFLAFLSKWLSVRCSLADSLGFEACHLSYRKCFFLCGFNSERTRLDFPWTLGQKMCERCETQREKFIGKTWKKNGRWCFFSPLTKTCDETRLMMTWTGFQTLVGVTVKHTLRVSNPDFPSFQPSSSKTRKVFCYIKKHINFTSGAKRMTGSRPAEIFQLILFFNFCCWWIYLHVFLLKYEIARKNKGITELQVYKSSPNNGGFVPTPSWWHFNQSTTA